MFPGKEDGYQIFEYLVVLGYPGDEYFSQFPIIVENEFDNDFISNFKRINSYSIKTIINPFKIYEVTSCNQLKD